MWFHILARLAGPKHPNQLPKPEHIERPAWLLEEHGKEERRRRMEKVETDPRAIAAWFQSNVG